jgi:hypothetical protein
MFVDDLFAAISRQEGEFSATPDIPKERNNPLDLRYAGQIGGWWYDPKGRKPPGGPPDPVDAPIAWFETLEHGIAAGYRQLWLCIAQGYTLEGLIYNWAPPSQNNSAEYLENVSGWTGIKPGGVLLALLELPPAPTAIRIPQEINSEAV